MKIIIIGTAFPMRGAMAQLNAILFKYLQESHIVKMFSFKRQYPNFLFPGKTQFEKSNPEYKIPDEKNTVTIDSINPFNWILTALKIRKENPDLLIYRYWMPFFAPCFFTISFIAKIFRKTKVLFICDNVIPHEKRIGDKILTKLVFSTVNYFLVHTKSVERDLKKLNKKNKPFVLSPHPLYNIFGDKVSKKEAKEKIASDYNINILNDNIILFFGYIRKYKGLNYLIEAMPKVLAKIKLKLLIVGEFYEDEKPYIEKINSLKLNNNIFVISDFVPDTYVRYFFSSCDCVVLPYIDATQSGIVLVCYYYNIPVIATNVGGISEDVINEKTGLIVKSHDSDAIAGAIIKFCESSLENQFSENIENLKGKYSWETLVNNIEKLVGNK